MPRQCQRWYSFLVSDVNIFLTLKDAATKAFAEKAGEEPDIANTFWAVAISKELGLEHIVDVPAVTDFVTSLQVCNARCPLSCQCAYQFVLAVAR